MTWAMWLAEWCVCQHILFVVGWCVPGRMPDLLRGFYRFLRKAKCCLGFPGHWGLTTFVRKKLFWIWKCPVFTARSKFVTHLVREWCFITWLKVLNWVLKVKWTLLQSSCKKEVHRNVVEICLQTRWRQDGEGIGLYTHFKALHQWEHNTFLKGTVHHLLNLTSL